VAAFKPVVTGLDDEGSHWPADHDLLAAAAGGGQSPEEVAPYRFGPAVSPHYAAELAGQPIEPKKLVEVARALGERADALVVEGVGGLLVPLTAGFAVLDLAACLGLPVAIAAPSGLGTISDSLLSLEAARAAGLQIAGVVLTPWSAKPTGIERDNRRTIEALGGAPVEGLSPTEPGSLGSAGRSLPLDRWLGLAREARREAGSRPPAAHRDRHASGARVG
jgi:dethiobiotin synthetase